MVLCCPEVATFISKVVAIYRHSLYIVIFSKCCSLCVGLRFSPSSFQQSFFFFLICKGRNHGLQGLASAIVKLWEKCIIAKIAIKWGALNTSNEEMADELKAITFFLGPVSEYIQHRYG